MQNTIAAFEQPSNFIKTARNVDLYELITPKLFSPDDLLDMREQFARSGYIKLPSFLSEDALAVFREEMEQLELIASRKKFEMPGYQTPRKLSVAGGSMIKSYAPVLYSLYHHYALRSCVEQLTGRRIYSCTHPEEYMVANFLHNSGDTHGWHLDDPAYALIIFAESPKENGGGEVEFISNWLDICRRKQRQPDSNIQDLIAWAEENGMVDRHAHNSGDAYLLRADINLHRVCPLKRAGERRSVVNLAFQTTSVARYGLTANLLYGLPDVV
ncbi:HalD/BesD family halogenase [Methylobacillus pratensis]